MQFYVPPYDWPLELVHGWTDAAMPRTARSGAHSSCPEVMASSRTVQLVSGVTRRRVYRKLG